MLLECFRAHVLRDLSDEDVVVNNLLGVGAEKVIVKGKRTGRLAWGELEVAHLFAGNLELVLFWDLHDSRVEGAVQIASDLRNTGEHDSSLILEDGGELGAGGLGLGQVVEVEVVLGTLGVVHNHCLFCFCFVWI